jgi:hypothetical protein
LLKCSSGAVYDPKRLSSFNSFNSYPIEKREGEIKLKEKNNFPELDKAAYHGLAGEIVRAIEPHSEAHSVGLLLTLLVVVGTVLGPSIHWRVSGTEHPLRAHAVLVGLTSKGRKGSSFSALTGLFRAGLGEDFLKENITTGLSSGEGLIFAVRDKVTKTETNKKTKLNEEVIVDSGVWDKRMVVLESEFGRVEGVRKFVYLI